MDKKEWKKQKKYIEKKEEIKNSNKKTSNEQREREASNDIIAGNGRILKVYLNILAIKNYFWKIFKQKARPFLIQN